MLYWEKSQRKGGIGMMELHLLCADDVDDLIFRDDTWSYSER